MGSSDKHLPRGVSRLLPERRPRDREATLSAVERISALTHLVASAEYLARPAERRHGGLNNWDVSRRAFHSRSPRVGKVADVFAKRRMTDGVHVVRIAAALALVLRTPARTRGVADALLAGTSAAVYPRHHYGTDGSDQVAFLVQTAATLARAGRAPRIVDTCLWYVALQATLAYAVSGWAKLAGPSWRSGEALPGVMRTLSYGDPAGWRLAARYPRSTRAAGVGILALECLFPAVFVWRGRLAPAILGSAMVFHVATARLMGLGRFVTSFGSFHPAVLYVTAPAVATDERGRVAAKRDDTLPNLCAAMLGGSLVAATIAQARRRAKVRRGRGDEQLVTVSTGNVLAFRRTGSEDRTGPVVILEAGLGSTAEHWALLEESMAERHQVVTYSRAGYGRSVYAHDGAYALDVALRDLLDLVEHIGHDGPVVLIGHSLGGWLVARAAERRPDLFAGIALVDSSHPGELQRSSRQAQSRDVLTGGLALMPGSLALGLGALLAPPGWIATLPKSVRGLALAQYRDPGMWRSALREWRATQAEFDAFETRLPRIEAPLLVLTAGFTARNDPIQQELHGELAAMSANARHEVVDRADHLQVLTDDRAARRVLDHVERFLADVVRNGDVRDGDAGRR